MNDVNIFVLTWIKSFKKKSGILRLTPLNTASFINVRNCSAVTGNKKSSTFSTLALFNIESLSFRLILTPELAIITFSILSGQILAI